MNMNPDTNVCSNCYHDHSSKSLAQRPYECQFCSKTFTSKDSLRYHKNKFHRDTTNAEKIEQLLEECLHILAATKRQAVQQEAAAEEEHSKRPRLDPDTYESHHVSSTTTFG